MGGGSGIRQIMYLTFFIFSSEVGKKRNENPILKYGFDSRRDLCVITLYLYRDST